MRLQENLRASGYSLRPYESRSVLDVMEKLGAGEKVLLVAPTGAGKTIIAREVATHFSNVLLVAHRREIIEQAQALGIRAMSVLAALKRGPRGVDLLIVDEAHRSAADTYRALMKRYRKAALLGLTATPRRTDGQGLCDAFTVIVQSAGIAELVEQGHLVPYRAYAPKIESLNQLAHMKTLWGDFKTSDLSELMNRPRLVGDVVREYKKHAAGRKAVVFAVSIEHSRALEWAFKREGIRAVHIDGRAKEQTRRAALKALADGQIDVLCNVNLFTEGWDCPPVSCVVMARPTASVTLYLQSVGRGMRPSDGKQDLIILDHAGNLERHGAPDAVRDWKLESDRQRAQREAEVAELKRLFERGFDSIEDELEEYRKWINGSYSAKEASVLLDTTSPSLVAHRHNIPIRGKGQSTRYSKKEIDDLISQKSLGCDADTLVTMFGVGRGSLARFCEQRGIPKISFGLYSKHAAEDTLRRDREIQSKSYSINDIAGLLGVTGTSARALMQRIGINANIYHFPGRHKEYRYDKHAIDSLVKDRMSAKDNTANYSATEAASKCQIAPSCMAGFAKQHGISSIRGRFRVYSRVDVDRFVKEQRDWVNKSYSPSDLRRLIPFSNSKVSAIVKEANIPFRGKAFWQRRYSKREVDALVAKNSKQWSIRA